MRELAGEGRAGRSRCHRHAPLASGGDRLRNKAGANDLARLYDGLPVRGMSRARVGAQHLARARRTRLFSPIGTIARIFQVFSAPKPDGNAALYRLASGWAAGRGRVPTEAEMD